MDNLRTELTFRDVDEGWVTARLGDVCEVNPSSKELPDEFIYIDLESVEDGQLLKEKVVKKENAPSRSQRVLEKNDILFQMVRPYQKNNLFFEKNGVYVASTGYAQIRTELSAKFFYHLFHTDNFVNEVLKKCTGSNYPAINSTDLSNLIIHYPLSIIHSTKIASCLSSLDDLIAAHSQKLELLKDHKKGLMQNLFPIDNYSTKLTFPDVDKGWATAQLGDVCEVNPSTRELPNEFIYIDLESVEDGRLLNEKVVKKENAPSRAQRVLEKNDILFQMVRPYQKNNLFFDKEGPYVASTGYAQIRTIQSPRFFYYLFHTASFVNEVLKRCTGSNYPAINSTDLSNIIINYPLSIIHSNKIASCLSSLDALITAQAEKIEQLKLHKKGLMQGLFPRIND